LFAIPSGIFGCVSKFFTKIPFISIVDGADIPKIKSDMSFLVRFIKPLFVKINSYCDSVILLEGLDDLAIPFLKNKKIYSISSGIDMPKIYARPGIGNQNLLKLLTIGRLTKRKGFDLILKACAIVKNSNKKFHLTIIGYGKEQQNLERMILRLNLESNVSLEGRIEHKNLASYYKNTDCYIFFGDREGQSLAMMDAIAYGLPVICSNHPGNTTFVKNKINGFTVEYPNVDSLADAILLLISNRNKVAKMGVESRSIAKHLSWAKVANKYKEIINRVLSDKKI
jgi:glycosyltransferase involved in cell wall biosynthesis